MLKYIYKNIERLYDKQVSSVGLAVFRICYSAVLFAEVLQLLKYRHLIFDDIPFLRPGELNVLPALVLWLLVIAFILFGTFTRKAILLNYVLTLVFIGTIKSYEYHMFYVYVGVNFLLFFIPVEKSLSLDRLRLKLKYSNTRFFYNPKEETSVLSYYTLILVAIAFVYIDSIFYKIASPIWMKGLGMWLPASLPQNTISEESLALNIKPLAKALGYLTVLFEASFLFLFFRKKWRLLLLCVGLGLHIGIFIYFPIPLFALGVSALYLLLVPNYIWKKIGLYFKAKEAKYIFFYDRECPLCIRTKIIIEHLDWFKLVAFKDVQTYHTTEDILKSLDLTNLYANIYSTTSNRNKLYVGIDTYRQVFIRIPILFFVGLALFIPGIYHFGKYIYGLVAKNRIVERCTEDNCGYIPPNLPVNDDQIKLFKNLNFKQVKVGGITLGLILLCAIQLNSTSHAKGFKLLAEEFDIASYQNTTFHKLSLHVVGASKIFLGITFHAVFMDYHFKGYNRIYALEAQDKKGNKYWLPIIDKDGQPSEMNYGFNWVKWTFRVAGPKATQEDFRRGIRDFACYWAVENDLNPSNLTFNIYKKEITLPEKWGDDFLDKQLDKDWDLVGKAYWEDNYFELDMNDAKR